MVDPASVGVDGRQLGRVVEHLRTRYVEPGKIAGCLPLVWRRGETVLCEPIGRMDLERDRPVTDDTLFRIYSMTKPVTSVAVLQLYEQGHFQLHDPVHRFLPEWRDQRVWVAGSWPLFQTRPVERPMTMRDLLTHMGGLTYGFMARSNVDHAYRKVGIGGAATDAGETLDSMVAKLAELPLEFSPGTAWNYSVATDVLGCIVERISGQRFDAYLADHVLGPLGMHDTGFSVPDSELGRFAANYQRQPDKRLALVDDPQHSTYGGERSFFSGGGGLVSTAHDYLRFCRMLLGGGSLDGVRILGRKTIELMAANHLPDGGDLTRWATGGSFSETSNEGYGFGLGVSVNLGPAATASVGSAGEIAWGGAASTIFWVDPAEELIVVFMTQLMPSGTFNFRGQLKALVYPALLD